jgi:hypothetical protein
MVNVIISYPHVIWFFGRIEYSLYFFPIYGFGIHCTYSFSLILFTHGVKENGKCNYILARENKKYYVE